MLYNIDVVKDLGYQSAVVTLNGHNVDHAVSCDDEGGWVDYIDSPPKLDVCGDSIVRHRSYGDIKIKLRK